MAAARIQRFCPGDQYELVYQNGAEISNEDALSCPPCESENYSRAWEINRFSTADGLPITFKEIGLATKNDPVLSKVLYLNLNVWPSHVIDDQLRL